MKDHETRISVLEYKSIIFIQDMSELKQEVKTLNRTVWTASGGIAVLLIVIKLIWH